MLLIQYIIFAWVNKIFYLIIFLFYQCKSFNIDVEIYFFCKFCFNLKRFFHKFVLGIQQYLFENNRIDNIFTDSYYEKFTDCLNEIAKKFSALYNEARECIIFVAIINLSFLSSSLFFFTIAVLFSFYRIYSD